MTDKPNGIAPCPSCGSTEVVAQAICMNCGQYRPELESQDGPAVPAERALPDENPLPEGNPEPDEVPPTPDSAADSHPRRAAEPSADADTDAGDPAAARPDSEPEPEARPRRVTAADLTDPNPVAEVLTDEEYLPECQQCGGAIDSGYCEQCGSPATKVRDHFTAAPADWVAGVCDRGIRHGRNEDAMALAVEGDRALLVVCDGVSTSDDSDVASMAAARAAVASLSGSVEGTADSLVEAVRVANEAVVDSMDPASINASSCTFVAAVVEPGRYTVANIGDSRAYWISDHGTSRQLSVDDSVAQLRIDSGIERTIAENGPGAHAITKWLGKDASDLNPTVTEHPITESGWLLVCSDGLWNYASEPEELESLFGAALIDNAMQMPSPADLAGQLTAWANDQGGKDNITVVLARLEPGAATAPDADILAAAPDTRTVPADDPTE